MKKTKALLTLSLTTALAFSLAACKSETRNQETPFGDIDSSVVLDNGTYSITEKELYNRLRYNNGYTAFKNKLDEIIYSTQIQEFKDNYSTNTEYQKKINEKVVTDIYGTTDAKALLVKMKNEAKTHELERARLKYIDSMAAKGIKLQNDDLKLASFDAKTKDLKIQKVSEELQNYYRTSIVKENANRAYLKANIDKEKIEKDGKEINNPNHFDEEKDFESMYTTSYMNYNTSKGIILRYNNAAEAKRALKGRTITASNALETYMALFNEYYSYDKSTSIENDERVVFVHDAKKNALNSYDAQIETIFLEELANQNEATTEKPNFLNEPVSVNGKYYLIYKFETVYTLPQYFNELDKANKADIHHKYTFSEIKDNKDGLKATALDKSREAYIESKLSNAEESFYSEGLNKLNIKIYDPYLENQFLSSYPDFKNTDEFNNNLIFKATDKDDATKVIYEYKVNDFYADIKKDNLASTATNLLINKMLYHEHYDYLPEDAEKNLEKSIKDDIANFKEGKAGLNKAYGEENYLFYSYGYQNKAEVIQNKLGEDIKAKYISTFVYDSMVTGQAINKELISNLKIIRDTAINIYNKDASSPIVEQQRNRDFDMKIDHILISIDNNADGQPDDLLQFIESIKHDEAALNDFTKAVKDLTDAILAEIKAINGHTVYEKLEYIVDAFNNGYPIYNGNGKTWNDFKTYRFILKAESLGDVDESSVNNYVPEFKDYVLRIFDKVVDKDIKFTDNEKKVGQIFFPNNGEAEVNPENYSYADLCATQFGYHLISLKECENNEAELNFELPKASYNDQYENLKIMLNEKDTDNKDDDIFAYVNIQYYDLGKDEAGNPIKDEYGEIYSSKVPSLNQVFAYYVEYMNGSVHSIKTNIKTDLSKLLDAALNKFKSSEFQEYLLVSELGKVEVKDETLDYSFDAYKTYLQNKSEGYDANSLYSSWYTAEWKR